MSAPTWRIRSVDETDDETGEPLYWHNGDVDKWVGWGDRATATVFDYAGGTLPIGGEWEVAGA